MAVAGGDAPRRLLDVAAGGGDVAVDLWRRACRDGVTIEIDVADVSPTALEQARATARAAGVPAGTGGVRFVRLDALREEIPGGYDAVVCSLFLHHLDDEDAVRLLRRLAAVAGVGLVVSDLVRGHARRALVGVAAHVVTRSPIVHVDAVRSVRAAFTRSEMRGLAARAGLEGARVRSAFPCRQLLTWCRR